MSIRSILPPVALNMLPITARPVQEMPRPVGLDDDARHPGLRRSTTVNLLPVMVSPPNENSLEKSGVGVVLVGQLEKQLSM